MRALSLLTSLALLAIPLTGCPAASGRYDEETIHPDAPALAPFTACSVTTAREASYGAMHVTPCAPLELSAFPPTSGTHFSQWADFGVYDAPVPWGFLLHAMEHGAVVIGYRCEGADCATLVPALEAVVDAQPVDPLCRFGEPNRIILTPMPDLEEQAIVALAWERMYLATCLDVPSLDAFVRGAYALGPENLCAPGVDGAATGWCP